VATASVDYEFSNGTTADADEVNANFTSVLNFLNASVVHADGSVAMSGILSLPASDPSTANQAARKSYVDAKAAAGASLLHLREVQAAGVSGGTFTSGSWLTRTLNTEVTDEIGSTLSSNQFTLPAGTYWVVASAPAVYVSAHQAKLRNVTDSTDTLIGTSEYTTSADTQVTTTRSFVRGRFTIAATKTFALQHRCSITRADEGLGWPANFGVTEIYSEVMIWKVI
jgi:hypothetical protein